MVGLGRMGANMSRRLMKAGHDLVVYDVNASAVDELAGEGAKGAKTIEEFIAKLEPPRSVWVIVPAAFTEDTVNKLAEHAQADDAIIDGDTSYYHVDIRRAKALLERGLHYVD